MTETKKATKAEKDAGGVQDALIKATEEDGFLGTKVDPLPNSEHSLESGPDAPSAAEQAAALAEAQGPTR